MVLNDLLDLVEPVRGEAVLHRQFDLGVQPELRVTVRTCNVHVHPILFQREEVESVALFSENRGAHADSITYTSVRPEVVDLGFGEDAVEIPEAAHDEVAQDEAYGDGDGGLVGFGAAVFEE